MSATVKFTKMHGAGNDYIDVYTFLYSIPTPEEMARIWSAPHTGIGSDGLVLIGESNMPEADFTMRIFNADGSEALMCGNASRCIGKYLFEKGITRKTEIRLLTLSGIKTLLLKLTEDGHVASVTVDMLEPKLHDHSLLNIGDGGVTDGTLEATGTAFQGTFVSMGNPHFVIFTEDISDIDIAHYGKILEYDPVFPQRSNIEFAQVMPQGIRTRVWERGSGITMACGTGACATAVAAAITGRATRESDIIMDGGTLHIRWDETSNHVYLSGPAEFVYEGEIKLK